MHLHSAGHGRSPLMTRGLVPEHALAREAAKRNVSSLHTRLGAYAGNRRQVMTSSTGIEVGPQERSRWRQRHAAGM